MKLCYHLKGTGHNVGRKLNETANMELNSIKDLERVGYFKEKLYEPKALG